NNEVAMRPAQPVIRAQAISARRHSGRRPEAARQSKLRRLALEGLEGRTLMAVLPSPNVLGQVDISNSGGNESAPSIAVDPTNSQHLVATWTRNDPNLGGDTTILAEASYSNDGGTTWTRLVGAVPVLIDPASGTTPRNFAQVTDTSVGFDRS